MELNYKSERKSYLENPKSSWRYNDTPPNNLYEVKEILRGSEKYFQHCDKWKHNTSKCVRFSLTCA